MQSDGLEDHALRHMHPERFLISVTAARPGAGARTPSSRIREGPPSTGATDSNRPSPARRWLGRTFHDDSVSRSAQSSSSLSPICAATLQDRSAGISTASTAPQSRCSRSSGNGWSGELLPLIAQAGEERVVSPSTTEFYHSPRARCTADLGWSFPGYPIAFCLLRAL